ncbi:hypothetical protein RHMOL_Rhmol07G0125600 [Rhododendron molle]|uniref:Uncharacterized protein n=1 Tax=Rhododendron molle TaxID=49168 RepID=A0ACC0MZV6_RHOML|nr:hypothetical protein RHMOL_Rhmol07G0125600 [Rhododendron molle]
MMSRPWVEVFKSVLFPLPIGLAIWLLICWRSSRGIFGMWSCLWIDSPPSCGYLIP